MLNKHRVVEYLLEEVGLDEVNMKAAAKAAQAALLFEEVEKFYYLFMKKEEEKTFTPELEGWMKYKDIHMQAMKLASERAELGEASSDKVFELIEMVQAGESNSYEAKLTLAIRELKSEASQYEELAKKWCRSMRQNFPEWPWC